jgi:hypothetical protein
MDKAYALAEAWHKTGVPVKLGGPALGEPGGAFVPGRYLKHGYVITSRGCPDRCAYCSVPAREGYSLRELEIHPGHNILDDNLLACSEPHIRAVFDMLKTQPEKPIFTGGLEARLLKAWHVDLLREVRAKRMYFAYDRPSEYEPLVAAGKLLREGGITKASHRAMCYVLIGYRGDSFEAAEGRLRQAWAAGFWPYAMLYRDENGVLDTSWHKFQREWVQPALVAYKLKEVC